MTPAITPIQSADLSRVIKLLEESGLPPDGIEELEATTLVAREADRIVGSAALELYDRSALLRSVAVEANLRGSGLGQRLTTAALDLARTRGVQTVYLITETAGGFFPRFGFTATDRAQVDEVVKQSVQFTKLCPASALVMRLDVG